MRSWTLPDLPTGRLREVVRAPSPVLGAPGRPVDPTSRIVAQLAADLLTTQDASPGCVGLAAHQVGEALQVFSVDVSGHPKTRTCHGRFVLCNARIVTATRKERGREGCLSVPDFTADVTRARRVTVAGELPVTGESVLLETDAFEAVCLQHELDHSQGFIILDRAAGPHAVHPRVTYQ